MKGMKFATGGDEAKVAAFGGALAESVLDDASAEERDDSEGDESDDGKPNGDDDSSEVEGAETSFEAKYEAILQLIFGSFNPIARSNRAHNGTFSYPGNWPNSANVAPVGYSPSPPRPSGCGTRSDAPRATAWLSGELRSRKSAF